MKKIMFGILIHVLVKMDDSVITCDEIIGVKQIKFNDKNIICKTQNFYILIAFWSIIIALLIAVFTVIW